MDVLDLINNGKIKRFFQTRYKPVFEGATYHITQRAPGKEPLFVENSDYLYILHLIKKCAKRFCYEVFSFVLMPNHIHLLVRFKKANMPTAMKNLFEAYAKFFNKKYERKGPVFCKPYRAALCLDDIYLIAASIYIHLNPLKAGLAKNFLDYRWSSCSLYIRDRRINTFLNYKFILSMLDKDIKKSRLSYCALMENSKKESIRDVLEYPKSFENFQYKIYKIMKRILSKEYNKKLVERDILNNEILQKEIDKLSSKKRLKTPHEKQARKFLVQQLVSRGYTITEIAQRLGISRKSIYNTLNFTL